jgi:hypothetical protein
LSNFWSPETRPWPTIRAIGLAFGAEHQAVEIRVGEILGLASAEVRREALVEIDELLGGGAHFNRGHEGTLLT